MHKMFFSIVLIGIANIAVAAGDAAPKFINLYAIAAEYLNLGNEWVATMGAIFVTCLIFLAGLRFKSVVEQKGEQIEPEDRFSFRTLVEILMEVVYGIARDNCGKNYRAFLGFLSTLFLFILFSNLSGLIPGLPPTTESMSTNVGMGLLAFLVYNFAGIREHGAGYIKQFLGPVVFLAPFMLGIELVSHMARPLSLGLRLMGNIFADHLLVGVFTNLTYFVVPSVLMFFGLMVACVQSYIFTLLTGIYVSMAVSHDH